MGALAGSLDALGGLGLFLLGMLLMTQGLRAAAGEHLNRSITRFTRSPWTGALTGATITVLVQSSSATTVATIGFVSAGLLRFSEAIGVLIGANVGTTFTGWIVAFLGFELDLGAPMMPLLLGGVLLRLLARGRAADAGSALAGFALIFLGIDAMKAGLAPLEGVVTPASLPRDSLGGRALLVLAGAAMAFVTQSSSASLAAALAALHAGTIDFAQAAALVIGMNVGTTVTGVLVTIGSAARARRTALAHVLFNGVAGAVAFLLLDAYRALVEALAPGGVAARAELAVAGFHTTINLLGALVLLPLSGRFARAMERLVPERSSSLTRHLEPGLLADARAAAPALARALGELVRESYALTLDALQPGRPRQEVERAEALGEAIAEARAFAEALVVRPEDAATRASHVEAMHALDHLRRLRERCQELRIAETLAADPELREQAIALSRAIEPGAAGVPPAPDALKAVRDVIRALRDPYRDRSLQAISARQLSASTGFARLDAVRWLHRVSYHAWRIALHVERARESAAG